MRAKTGGAKAATCRLIAGVQSHAVGFLNRPSRRRVRAISDTSCAHCAVDDDVRKRLEVSSQSGKYSSCCWFVMHVASSLDESNGNYQKLPPKLAQIVGQIRCSSSSHTMRCSWYGSYNLGVQRHHAAVACVRSLSSSSAPQTHSLTHLCKCILYPPSWLPPHITPCLCA